MCLHFILLFTHYTCNHTVLLQSLYKYDIIVIIVVHERPRTTVYLIAATSGHDIIGLYHISLLLIINPRGCNEAIVATFCKAYHWGVIMFLSLFEEFAPFSAKV